MMYRWKCDPAQIAANKRKCNNAMYFDAVQRKMCRSNKCSEYEPRPARRDEKIQCFKMTEVVGRKYLCQIKRKRKKERRTQNRCCAKKREAGVSVQLRID